MLTACGLPLIIDFGSDSCIPYKEIAPVLQTMNAVIQGKVLPLALTQNAPKREV
jgi:thioredoxin 1